MKVLSLSTYPIERPRHGGQRRTAAFADFYRAQGWSFHYACVYAPGSYGGREVGADDIALGHGDARFTGVPFVEDLQSGAFAAASPAAYAHFQALVQRLRPDVVQLDHPFMWPLVERLAREGALQGARLIYASHNWEAPLKAEILARAGVGSIRTQEIAQEIVRLETELTRAADLTVAVSTADAERYRALQPAGPVSVIPNGVVRPPATAVKSESARLFEGRRFFFFVGSAYPPNIEGFAHLVAEGGLFLVPPRKHFAVCGGVSDGVFSTRTYQRFLVANSARLHFFADIDDRELHGLKMAAHAILLPIEFGGGSNLKTAEALTAGKHVIATSTALRGFEPFAKAEGVRVADTPKAFRRAMIEVLAQPPLKLSAATMKAREALYWDRAFADSDFPARLRALAAGVQEPIA